MSTASAHTDTLNGDPDDHLTGDPQQLAADEERVMDLLHEHVPLTLLCDLLDPHHRLDSSDILAAEGTADDHWWEPPTHNID